MKISPIAAGLGAGMLLLLGLAPAAGGALGALDAARAKRGQLAAAAAAPDVAAPLIAPGFSLSVPDVAAARAAMMARVQRLAKAGRVLVEETSAAEAPQGLAALRVRVSGAEKAVLALAEAFERERPLMRFRHWRLEPVPGGVRLTGEALAVRQ